MEEKNRIKDTHKYSFQTPQQLCSFSHTSLVIYITGRRGHSKALSLKHGNATLPYYERALDYLAPPGMGCRWWRVLPALHNQSPWDEICDLLVMTSSFIYLNYETMATLQYMHITMLLVHVFMFQNTSKGYQVHLHLQSVSERSG